MYNEIDDTNHSYQSVISLALISRNDFLSQCVTILSSHITSQISQEINDSPSKYTRPIPSSKYSNHTYTCTLKTVHKHSVFRSVYPHK